MPEQPDLTEPLRQLAGNKLPGEVLLEDEE
jgi:hypothetical protein